MYRTTRYTPPHIHLNTRPINTLFLTHMNTYPDHTLTPNDQCYHINNLTNTHTHTHTPPLNIRNCVGWLLLRSRLAMCLHWPP